VDGLELEVWHRNDAVVLLVRGEIDLATAPELARTLDEIGEGQSVILDIAEVSSLDARGIAVVVDHDRKLRARGHGIALRGASPLVRRVLEITGDTGLVEDLVDR
jgi:anti-sigma B factor antagonist